MTKTPKLSQEMQDCLNWLKLNPGWHSGYRTPWKKSIYAALYERGLIQMRVAIHSFFPPISETIYAYLPHKD